MRAHATVSLSLATLAALVSLSTKNVRVHPISNIFVKYYRHFTGLVLKTVDSIVNRSHNIEEALNSSGG